MDDDEILDDVTTDNTSGDDNENNNEQSTTTEDTNTENNTTTTNISTHTTTETETYNLVDLLNINDIPINIPIEFLFVYNKLLLVMIELGESMLMDCKALCSSRNMPIVECYHMFKAAVAAKRLSYVEVTEDETKRNYYAKLADTLLNYVRLQLNCITNNYRDDISFVLPIGADGLVNLFVTKNDVNVEVIVQGPDVDITEAIMGIQRDAIEGSVVTSDSEETYELTEEELDAHQHWHVLNTDNEFVPGTSSLHLNGVRYFLHVNYEEWVITEDGIDKGIGIILTDSNFDIADSPDHIYVEAKILHYNQTE